MKDIEIKHNHCHHHHSHSKNTKNLLVVSIITASYMLAEFIGGYYTNSLALMADAGHMLGDVGSLLLSFIAIWFAHKHAPKSKTFGYFRGEIIAAFLNGLTLLMVAILIVVEAFHRFSNIQTVSAKGMLIIAFGGLLINIIGACILHKGSEENLNIKGAYLHILADLAGSIGAIIAGILMYFYNWYLIDPIISCFISILVLISSFGILKSTFDILMESVPENIDVSLVQKTLEEVEGVKNLHDLHIWSINSTEASLSVHIVAELEKYETILSSCAGVLKEKFDIKHITIQIEPENFHDDNCYFQ